MRFSYRDREVLILESSVRRVCQIWSTEIKIHFSLVNSKVRKYLNIIESLWRRNNQLQFNYIIIYLPYLLTHTLFYMYVKVKWQYTYTHISILTIWIYSYWGCLDLFKMFMVDHDCIEILRKEKQNITRSHFFFRSFITLQK